MFLLMLSKSYSSRQVTEKNPEMSSKLNLPISMVKPDTIEELLGSFFPQIGHGNSQVINFNSFQINREKMPSFASVKSELNYCLGVSSVCFDWSPDDNLFVHNNPRLSKLQLL
jgi:hypothetical protein